MTRPAIVNVFMSTCMRAVATLALCGACGEAEPTGDDDDRAGDLAGDTTGPAPEKPGAAVASSSYFPIAIGNAWTYRVTEGAAAYTKIQSVEAHEPVGGAGPNAGTMAFRLLSRRRAGTADEARTVSWQGWDGARLVRHRELAFDPGIIDLRGAKAELFWVPGRLRFDARPAGRDLVSKPKWIERFDEREADLHIGGASVKTCPPEGCGKVEDWEVLGEQACNLTPAPLVNGATRPSLRCLRLHKKALGTETGKYYDFAAGLGKVREIGLQSMETLVEATIVGGASP